MTTRVPKRFGELGNYEKFYRSETSNIVYQRNSLNFAIGPGVPQSYVQFDPHESVWVDAEPATTCYYCGKTHDQDHIWTSTLLQDGRWLDVCEDCLTHEYNEMVALKDQGTRKITHALTEEQWSHIIYGLQLRWASTGNWDVYYLMKALTLFLEQATNPDPDDSSDNRDSVS